MHTLPFRKLSLICALALASACGDDKGSTETETTGTTPATTGQTTGGATMTDPSGGTTSEEQTTEPTTNTPTSTPPTTSDATTNNPSEATTDMTTEDPTAGGGGSFCQEACVADMDCTIMGAPTGLTCQEGRCMGMPVEPCPGDNACRATFSGWLTPCASQAECPGQTCIDIGGEGRCAFPSNGMCEMAMMEEIMVPVIEGGMEIAVCANTDFVCKDDICQNPCDDNLECGAVPGHPQCNVGSGACECSTDDDCKNSGQPGYAACNEGRCGCAVDADCAGAFNADVCTKDGFCGCSSAAACTMKSFDGTMTVCEGA